MPARVVTNVAPPVQPIPYHAGLNIPGLGFAGISVGRGVPPAGGRSDIGTLAMLALAYVIVFHPQALSGFIGGLQPQPSTARQPTGSVTVPVAPTQNIARTVAQALAAQGAR